MRAKFLVLVWLALAAAGCGSRKATSVEIDPALARLVPSDTTALMDVKVDALRATPLYQKYVAGRLASMKAGADASELLAVFNGKDGMVFAKEKTGVFQYDRGGRKTSPSGRGGGAPAALQEKMRSIPPENQIWAVGLGGSLPAPDMIPDQGNLANLRNVFKALESWTVAADLRSGLKMRAGAVYKTEQDAKQIHDALRGIIGLARLSTPNDAPELLQLYDGIQISMEKTSVRVSADIAAGVLDKALGRLERGQR
jgi:hypothetical protein